MQEKELEMAGGSLYYEIHQGEIVITRQQGILTEVTVPEIVEGLPVKRIAKKAFLSKKYLRRVQLPDTIREIGDWAFAYCDSLEQVVLPSQAFSFGRAVFLECGKLASLFVPGKGEGTAALLAAAVTAAEAYYLLDTQEAGTVEWLSRWDARMLEILRRPDEEGFSKQILCGEEDYGSTDLNRYMQERRKGKVRLLFLRLLHCEGLESDRKRELETYLKQHTKGCTSEETWLVVWKEHGNDRAWYELFTELGCLTEDNFEGILNDVGEECPEMKAFFMRYKEEKIGYADFFADLEL